MEEQQTELEQASKIPESSSPTSGKSQISKHGRVIKRKKFDDDDEAEDESKGQTFQIDDMSPTSSDIAQMDFKTDPSISPTMTSDTPKRRGPGRPPGSGKKYKATTPEMSPREPKKRGPYKKRSEGALPQIPLAGSDKWTAQDDLMLKEAAQTNTSFDKIAKKIKFSMKFTGKDVEERWRSLLYDPAISSEAAKAMAAAPTLNKRVLWSPEEEDLIKRELQSNAPNFNNFQNILEKYRDSFHSSRTAKSLEAHYYRMKRTGAFDKKVDPNGTAGPSDVVPSPLEVLSFPKPPNIEEMEFPQIEEEALAAGIEDMDPETVKNKKKAYVKQEILHQKEILKIERDLEKDKQIDSHTLAIIRGRSLRYNMKSMQILLGRACKDNIVDINLADEGEANRISRQQAIIKLKPDCNFYLKNIGKRPVFVNGRAIESGKKKKLKDLSLIELEYIRLIFDINTTLINTIKEEYKAKRTTKPPAT